MRSRLKTIFATQGILAVYPQNLALPLLRLLTWISNLLLVLHLSSSSDIPGLVTGSSWRPPPPKTAPPHQPMEPGSPPKTVLPSLPSVQHSAQPSVSERIPASPKKSPSSAVPPAFNKPTTLPPRLTISVPKKPAIVNPFVSGGFMTEFVGSPASLTAQKSLPPKSRTGSPNMSEAQASITVLMMDHWTDIGQSSVNSYAHLNARTPTSKSSTSSTYIRSCFFHCTHSPVPFRTFTSVFN
ncbi:hypothetical protein EDB19DRAFT_105224 [Suillus lakei]|nr:hypothetical protein EDB19DRAFT_105224 [Suillus lakei]